MNGESPQLLVNRNVRSVVFRGHVLDVYDNRCAVTGLRMVDGGGKTEAQAAHIWSVADGGPDIRRAWVELRWNRPEPAMFAYGVGELVRSPVQTVNTYRSKSALDKVEALEKSLWILIAAQQRADRVGAGLKRTRGQHGVAPMLGDLRIVKRAGRFEEHL